MPRAWSILGNSQRLDGGAMFGNAPRAMWQRWIAPDADNRIPLACRALLIADGDRTILFEAGIGAFFPPALAERYGIVEREHVLLRNLDAAGFSHADIDVVVLSHLHFDHAGGLLASHDAGAVEGAPAALLFPRARFVVGARAFERACHPHPRDRASFIPELPGLLEASGRLELVDGPHADALGDGYRLHYSDGHTPGLLLTEIAGAQGPVVYASDLIPGAAWVHVPITMGYDRHPELLVDEKRALLEDLLARGGRLFFTHDHEIAIGRVDKDARDRFVVSAPAAALDGTAL